MSRFVNDDCDADEIARQTALYEPLAHAVRGLVDATIRTIVPDDEVRAVTAQVEALTARLAASQIEGSYGVRYSADGRSRAWGNVVVGLRNAAAAPLQVHRAPDAKSSGSGRVWSETELGAAFEGPPGMVHGGVSAMLLDQMLGEAAGAAGHPGMTATYQLTYRRPVPLGPLRLDGWVERTEEFKTWARGTITGPDGVCVEAEGLFVLPRWARERVADGGDRNRPMFFE